MPHQEPSPGGASQDGSSETLPEPGRMLLRLLVLVHRYLAVVVGLLMTLWCLSGFVMMYQGYPALAAEQRLAGLAPLQFDRCCTLPGLAVENSSPLPPFRINMLLGDPVLRLSGAVELTGELRGELTVQAAPVSMLNLRTGQPIAELTFEQILAVAREFATGNSIIGAPRSLGTITTDQWTLQTGRRNGPVHHLAFDDTAGTEIYISGRSGEVFQHTTRRTRVLAWLGAIPHWLYPSALRQQPALWTQVVIWTSIAGTILTGTGLYLGWTRLQRNRKDQWSSPYKGWWYWHHVSGLLFGVLALTWVFSGLLTMNPWGALADTSNPSYDAQLRGNATWGELRQLLTALPAREAGVDMRELQAAPFNQRLHVIASQAGDSPDLRLDVEARLAQLAPAEVERALASLQQPILELQKLEREDSYYYAHQSDLTLPVYRAILDDAEQTRIYVHHETGQVMSINSTGRWSRWLRTGLHDLDFPVLRWRPLWDVVVIMLLTGVTLLCAIGTWLAIKRVQMDFRRLLRQDGSHPALRRRHRTARITPGR